MTGAAILALVVMQNALDGNLRRGSGTELDASLRQGSRVNQPIAATDYRSRNLVVTGDVAGGRGFRGTVGYSAEGDFRGALGSDSNREFRANSALSSVHAQGALPINDRFAIATGIGAVSYRRETTALPASSPITERTATTGRLQYSARETALANADRVRLDMATRSLSLSRELSTLTEPISLKTVPVAGGRKAKLIASPYTGLVAIPTDDMIESLSLGVYGSALLRSDLRFGRADRDKIAKSYVSVNDRSAAARLDTRVVPPGSAPTAPTLPAGETPARRNAYDRIATSMADRVRGMRPPGAAGGSDVTAADAISRVRQGFMRAQEESHSAIERITGIAQPPGTGIDRSPDDVSPIVAPATVPAPPSDVLRVAPTDPSLEPDSTQPRVLTGAEVAVLLAYRAEIDHLDGGSKEALDSLLAVGEMAMRSGRFLTAERAFVAATLVAPANPLPLVGLANSEIAAGLDAAASLALRQLFLNYPEMIAAKYAPELLGPSERLQTIAQRCLENGKGSRLAGDCGIVAAYIGYQLDDPAMTEAALALLETSENDAPLAKILRAVWAHVAAAPADAAPADAAPADAAPPTQ